MKIAGQASSSRPPSRHMRLLWQALTSPEVPLLDRPPGACYDGTVMERPSEIIVTGAGVIGLTCAWRLAQAGLKVTLLERGKCGGGATGASLGALMPPTSTRKGPLQRVHRQSLWTFEAFADELGEVSGIEVGFERRGRLEVLHDDQRRRMAAKEAEVAREEWPALGDGPVMEVIGPEAARELEPAVTVSEFGALLCRATGQVGVDRLVAALRAAGERAGVTILEDREVTGIDIAEGRVRGVRCSGEAIPAPAVLAAAGAWTSQLCPELARHAPVRPVKGQAILLQPQTDEPLFDRMIKRRKIYLLRQPGPEVLLGSTTEPEAGFDQRVSAEGVADLTAGAVELMPSLSDAAVVRMWAGLRPEGADHWPLIGVVPEVEGLFVAAGHYKTGLGLAPLTGCVLVDLITTGSTEFDVSPFYPGRGTASS